MQVDPLTYDLAVRRIIGWARAGESRYVCLANVHMVMEAYDDPRFRALVNEADMVTPDGMPLVWALRLLGESPVAHVYGSELTPRLCAAAASEGLPVGFYGGSEAALEAMVARLHRQWPALPIVYQWSPPFRPLSLSEEENIAAELRASGARLLFVGLGCPKQERWMAAYRGRINAAMVGVGAAFDFLAGTKRQAPRLLQQSGLEWAFRLSNEPRRLWRRYLYHNPRFLGLFAAQLAWTKARQAVSNVS
jgi:N-acetylglucosaminyldiphosphoundecaprenol N-acetyl-beta-D-mannosaminyltransferase